MARNPLAEPGILGITGGAGLAAVLMIISLPDAGIWTLSGAAAVGALAAFGLVYGLSARGGLSADRLTLVGIGVWSGAMALITLILVATNPRNIALTLTWLSGSTYGRTLPQVIPVVLALAVVTPAAVVAHRELDLMALDDDTPRLPGVKLHHTRLGALTAAPPTPSAGPSWRQATSPPVW